MELTENEFLISRALGIFNEQYHRDIKVEDCDIFSIEPDPHSDRGYEITTPLKSEFFRIRFYIKFTDNDRSMPVLLEVTPPYITGKLGDEVYVIHSGVDIWYRASGTYKFNPLTPGEIPAGTIVTERGLPIVSEDGAYLVVEAA